MLCAMAKFSLPPGFRFHPTDAELVSFYLKRKVCGRRIEFESIGDVDLYRFEPWDLPEMSRLQTKDLEWYFFCPRDRKYPNGSRTNRATEQGYWKATGKDRGVSTGARNVGMKKTLVYYKGRAPKGERTNWVIHEYRLSDTECERMQAVQNAFVLCRLYKKSGAGPKNGEQYGAPVEDDDWETGEHSSDENRSEMINFHSNMIASYGHDTPGKEFLESDQRPDDHHGAKLDEVLTEVQDRGIVLPFADRCVGESWTVPSGQCNPVDGSAAGFVDEEDILRQILELAENKVADGYDVSESNMHTESGQIDDFIGKDGDFLEMDDLLAPLRSNDVTEVERRGHLLDSSMQLSPGERQLEWQSQTQVHLDGLEGTEFTSLSDLQLTGVRHQLEKFIDCAAEESGSKVEFWDASVESQSPFINCGINSNPQAAGDILLGSSDIYASKLDAPCHGSSLDEELNYEDVLEVLEQFKGSNADKEPLNLEALADNMQREIDSSDMSSNLALQDGLYFDALTDFFGERQNPDLDFLHQAVDKSDLTSFESSYENVPQVQNKVGSNNFEDAVPSEATLEGKLILNWVSRGNAMESESTQREQVGTINALHLSSTNSDGLDTGLEGKQSSKAFDIFYNYLGSLQGLPASAADLSPRAAASVNSISVRAMDVRAVAVTCTCTKDGLSSVCMSCSVTKDKKKGSFVRSLSFREKTVERTNAGFFMVAVLGVIWAFFWLLMFGGAWKLFGSVYRLVWS